MNLEINKKLRKERKKKANPVRINKSAEVRYRRQLTVLTTRLRRDTATSINPILKQFESEYTNDGYATSLQQAFDNLRTLYNDVGRNAKIVANSFVDNSNNKNKQRFYNSIENAIGIDLSTVIQNEGLDDILLATTNENVALIRSIPEEYFKQIESAVYRGTTQGNTASSLISEIRTIGKTTTSRAKLIARDQTTKLNSALNQQRQQNLGVEEYIWRTAGDDRVRETHDDHNGKTFRWDDPPKDTGHPGKDIQCRCVAQAIINL